jgi:aryl-alcohol dehydrogenase-like predicted oxidoreductase
LLDNQKRMQLMDEVFSKHVIGLMGIGTRAWGAKRMWGYGEEFFDEDLLEVIKIATNSGIRFFDTAEIYGRGRSEELLGKFIKELGTNAIVATKYAPFPWRFGRFSLRKALQNSLKRLGIEQVDLYQIHWPWPLASIEKLMDGLADAVEAGLVKAVGVSNYNLEQMKRAYNALAKRGVRLASNQVKYNLLHREPETNGLLDLCRELDIALIAYGPIGEGMLTNKYNPKNPPMGPRRRKYDHEFLSSVQPLFKLMQEIGEAHGNKSPAQVALNWVIAKGAIPIPGAKTGLQAEENIGAMGWTLAEEEVSALDKASLKV